MKRALLWFTAYLALFIGLAGVVLRADSEIDVVVALNLLTCAATFAYTVCFRNRIARRPDSMLSFFFLWLLSVLVCYPIAVSLFLRH